MRSMNKLSKRAIDKINLFLNDKEFDCLYLSRREVKILFYIYQNATSEIFELEEENQQLKSQLKQRDDVIDETTDYIKNIQNEYATKMIMLEPIELLSILNKVRSDKND